MVSPKQVEFSTPDGASRDTRSVRKSQRTPTSKRAASDEAGGEEKSKMDKKKRKIKKEKLASSPINRIWNSEDEVIILKGLTKYKAERGMESKLEWEEFYPLVGDSITAKFSKEQIMGKIRKLRGRFFDHYEKVKKGVDSHSITFSNPEAFKLAMKIWEKNESDCSQEMLKENEEAVNETEAEEHENTKEAQINESGEEVLKEQNEVANAEPLIGNGADADQFNDKRADAEQFNDDRADTEQLNDDGEDAEQLNDDGAAKQSEKEKQNAEAEFANVQDAFETLLSHDLSDHQKGLEFEKLRKVENETRRKLSDGWNAICATEWNLKIRKFKYTVFLAEASKGR